MRWRLRLRPIDILLSLFIKHLFILAVDLPLNFDDSTALNLTENSGTGCGSA